MCIPCTTLQNLCMPDVPSPIPFPTLFRRRFQAKPATLLIPKGYLFLFCGGGIQYSVQKWLLSLILCGPVFTACGACCISLLEHLLGLDMPIINESHPACLLLCTEYIRMEHFFSGCCLMQAPAWTLLEGYLLVYYCCKLTLLCFLQIGDGTLPATCVQRSGLGVHSSSSAIAAGSAEFSSQSQAEHLGTLYWPTHELLVGLNVGR